MFETMATFVLQEHLAAQSFDPPVGPVGDLRLLSPHNKPVQTSDGWISFTVNTDSQVRAFLTATERNDLLNDERFNSVAARATNVKEWFAVRGAPLTHKSTQVWLDLLQSADIAAQACHTLETLPKDKHLQAVGLIQYEDHPTEGKTAAIRSSIKVDNLYPQLRATSQPKGWETQKILEEMGYSANEVATLMSKGTAVASDSQ
jgi:crotonobetainyl-CoA:carnitine CoA-transferase CaiB-like acyl-CoA transferase